MTQPYLGAAKITISAPSNAIGVTGAQSRSLAAVIHRYTPQSGSYGVLATNDIAGGVVRAFTGSRTNHTLVDVGGGKAVQMTPDGVALTELPDDPNIVWSQPILDPATANAICIAAKSMVGRPATTELVGVPLERWAWTLPQCISGAATYMIPAMAYFAAGISLTRDNTGTTTDELLDRIWRSEASSLWASAS